MTLLYRASEHGFESWDFHIKCDNKPKTLTLIKSLNGNIFGGYTDLCWDSTSGYKCDPNAFLFSLTNWQKQSAKIQIRQNYGQAIFCHSTYGPSFGDRGNELVVSQGTDNMRKGWSKLNNCYRLANYPQGSDGSNFLAGSTWFEVTEVEVFMKN